MAGWSPQEPTKTGYDSIVRTRLSEGVGAEQEVAQGVAPLDLSTPVAPGAANPSESPAADPERAERFTGFYACSQCGWFNRGGRCSCGRERVPVMKPIDIPKGEK